MNRIPIFRKKIRPLKVMVMLSMAALFLAAVGGLIMFLWNYTLPHLIGVRSISFWQAVALFVLLRLLGGGFRWRAFGGGGRHRGRGRYWKEKWMNMSEEERTHFKNRWKEYCKRQ